MKKKSSTKFIVLFVVTILLFCALLFVQYYLNFSNKKVRVIVTKETMNANTKLSEANINTYLTMADIPESFLPEDYITDPGVILDKQLITQMNQNEIITTKDIIDETEAGKMNEYPNVYSFSLSSSGAATKWLKEGDVVHVLARDNETGVGYDLFGEEMIISAAYNNEGNAITQNDTVNMTSSVSFRLSDEQLKVMTNLPVKKFEFEILPFEQGIPVGTKSIEEYSDEPKDDNTDKKEEEE